MSIQLKGNDESLFSDDVEITGRVTGNRLDIRGGEGGSPATCLAIYADNDDENAFITTDGAASFVGGRARLASDGNFELYNGSNNVAAISAGDGSAHFANSNILFNGTGATSFKGAIEVDRESGTNTGIIIRENGTARTRLYADGRATLASSIEALGGVYASRDTDQGFAFVGRVTGSTNSLQITAGGTIYAAGTTIQPISSERRLKENIVPINSDTAWETIKSTPYYAYNFIGNTANSYGPMADEVPGEMKVATDRTDDVGVIHTFDNGMLQARLYTALQTALTRIEALEAEVQSLKGGQS